MDTSNSKYLGDALLASLLTSTEKTTSKPGATTTEIHNKPRLKRITKFTTMQNNHASGTQKYYNSK